MDDKKLVHLGNLDKLSKSLDSRYKDMIQEETNRATTQEGVLNQQIARVEGMLGGKSLVYLTSSEYEQLSDAQKNDPNIVYNITDADVADHEHENKDILDSIQSINLKIGNKLQAIDYVQNLEYSIEDIGAAAKEHNHDDRYYTVSDMNIKLSEKADEVYSELSKYFMCDYDEAGSIGKRYRREDEIGTPYCVTVDFETENDGCVTVRDRDTMEQVRVKIDELENWIEEKVQF